MVINENSLKGTPWIDSIGKSVS